MILEAKARRAYETGNFWICIALAFGKEEEETSGGILLVTVRRGLMARIYGRLRPESYRMWRDCITAGNVSFAVLARDYLESQTCVTLPWRQIDGGDLLPSFSLF